jgi:hypothetical protein
MRKPLVLAGVLGVSTLLSASSGCTQVLGTFEPGVGGGAVSSSSADASSTSSAGGASGVGVGGAGGGVPEEPSFDYSCVRGLKSPKLLTQISDAGGAFIESLHVAERGKAGAPRVLLFVRTSGTSELSAINVDAPEQVFVAKNLVQVLDVKRLSASMTGILAIVDKGTGPSLVMLELPDAKDEFVERLLLAPANLTVDMNSTNYSGGFVPLDPTAAAWSADVVLTFKGPGNVGVARYGNFTASGGKSVSFVDANSPLAQSGMRLFTMFRSKTQSRTYAYIAPNQEGQGTFEFALDAAVTGIVPPRGHGGGLMLSALERPTGFNVMSLDFMLPELALRGARLPFEMLGAFDSADLALHGKFNAEADVLPIDDPAFGWFGDIFAFIGGQTKNANGGSDDLGYYFIDPQAKLRGSGKFPVKLPPAAAGFAHRGIGNVAAAIAGGVLAGPSGRFHVGWVDEQEDASFNRIHSIVYDELVCTGTPAPAP